MNFSFFSHFFLKKTSSNTPVLYVDVHSHVIPGIDDGAKDMKESLTLLRALKDEGYKKIITTPHIMVDAYYNTPQSIMQGLELLKKEALNAGIDIEIEAAAEYYLDDGFLKHLHRDDVLLINNEYLLFETSYIAKPLYFEEMITEIINAGYKPLFAHPERYRYIQNLADYKEMKAMGIFFQVNLNSFGGHYGKDAKIKANFLNKSGFIDLLGSDTHHLKQVKTVGKIKKTKLFRTIFTNNIILNNALLNNV